MGNMLRKGEEPLQELIRYVLGVDRRIFVIKEFQHCTILQASGIAKKVGRSFQNISRALKELEEKGIVISITPKKRTWKKYILSEKGKQILIELKKQGLI